MKADNEAQKAFEEWFEGLRTRDDMVIQLEPAQGPGNKAQGPEWAEDED